MTPEQYRRAQQLFDAVESLPRELCAPRLTELCPDDPALRVHVLELLDTDPRRIPALEARIGRELLTRAEDQIGPYRVIRRIGEGGMGEVWLAEQLEPIRRQVAIKLVPVGMASRRVLARFYAERQAMGLMDHPAIAHIFDAGVTEHGLPYFAMEYVDGLPITAFCDEHRLSLEARLRLFLRVCEGVQHAHQKTVLHRDIKPSNLLVRMQDGRPAPKIIDFGIAKALREPLAARPMQTEIGVIVGTPEYMSPERLGGTESEADARTDVYALGMILYELLVGALPFDAARLRTSSREHIQQHIAGQCLTRPSTLFSRTGRAREIARRRATEPAWLAAQLEHDLDWIVMKSIAPEIARRYPSVATLAEDIEHFLDKQPVSARPPSAAYVMSRFLARHRQGAIVTVTLASMLIAGVAGTAVGLVRARHAEALARRDAAMAEQSLGFLLSLFRSTDPLTGGALNLTAREMLDGAARQLDAGADLGPAARARLKQAIGNSYLSVSEASTARKYLEQALAEQEAVLGADHSQTLQTLVDLARMHWGFGSLAEAERLARHAVTRLRATAGPVDRATMRAEAVLVDVLARRGRTDEALPLATDLLDRRHAVLGAVDLETADSLHALAALRLLSGDIDSADRLNHAAFAVRRAKLGATHVTTMLSEMALADVAVQRGNLAAAEATWRNAVALIESRWGALSKPGCGARQRLGSVLYLEGNFAEAESQLDMALRGFRQVLQPGHPDLLAAAHLLGLTELALGKPPLAEPLLREACEGRRTAFGRGHPHTEASCRALDQARLLTPATRQAAN